MEVVENRLDLHLGRVVEQLVAVQAVLIDGDVTVQGQLENVCKQVHLFVDGLHGIVQSGIVVLVQVYLAVDVAPPYHVLGHVHSRGEHQAGSHGNTLVLALLLLLLCLLLLLLATGLGLGTD